MTIAIITLFVLIGGLAAYCLWLHATLGTAKEHSEDRDQRLQNGADWLKERESRVQARLGNLEDMIRKELEVVHERIDLESSRTNTLVSMATWPKKDVEAHIKETKEESDNHCLREDIVAAANRFLYGTRVESMKYRGMF